MILLRLWAWRPSGKGKVGKEDGHQVIDCIPTAYMFRGQHSKRKGLQPGVRKRSTVAKVIERIEAHYEVQDVEMGKVYRWCPERAVVECTCGEELTLSALKSTCGECGADHAAIVEDVLDARPQDKGDHPWRSLQPYTPTRGT